MTFNHRSTTCPTCGDEGFESGTYTTWLRVRDHLRDIGKAILVWNCGHWRTVTNDTWTGHNRPGLIE